MINVTDHPGYARNVENCLFLNMGTRADSFVQENVCGNIIAKEVEPLRMLCAEQGYTGLPMKALSR